MKLFYVNGVSKIKLVIVTHFLLFIFTPLLFYIVEHEKYTCNIIQFFFPRVLVQEKV